MLDFDGRMYKPMGWTIFAPISFDQHVLRCRYSSRPPSRKRCAPGRGWDMLAAGVSEVSLKYLEIRWMVAKFCISWWLVYRIIYRVSTIRGDARFLTSTVCTKKSMVILKYHETALPKWSWLRKNVSPAFCFRMIRVERTWSFHIIHFQQIPRFLGTRSLTLLTIVYPAYWIGDLQICLMVIDMITILRTRSPCRCKQKLP